MNAEKKAQISAGRRLGASPYARARMVEGNSHKLWTAHCRKCRAKLKGTPGKLNSHVCAEDPNGDQSSGDPGPG